MMNQLTDKNVLLNNQWLRNTLEFIYFLFSAAVSRLAKGDGGQRADSKS